MADYGTPNTRMVSAEEIDERTSNPGAKVRFEVTWEGSETRCEVTVEVRARTLEEAIPKARDELHRVSSALAASAAPAGPASSEPTPPEPDRSPGEERERRHREKREQSGSNWV